MVERQHQLTERATADPGSPDRLGDLEEEFMREQSEASYEEGLQTGKRVGHEEGYKTGFDMGTERASEIGFYRGYSLTWLHLLQNNPASNKHHKTASILSKLNEVLELTNSYPKTNETSCEQKLLDIRLKFKQSTTMLNNNPL